MATESDLVGAEDRLGPAAQVALGVFLGRLSETVFADPARPDWPAWDSQEWFQTVDGVVRDTFAAVAREQGAREGLTGLVLDEFVANAVTQAQEILQNPHIPDRVLQESTQATQTEEYQQDPGGAIAALLVASAPVWAGMLGVFGGGLAAFAVNAAAFVGAEQQQREDPSIQVRKTWNAVLDSRTRFTHRIANGQTVNLGDVFIVGGFPMRFPHDPFGPPQEVINCRCVLSRSVRRR